MENELSMAFYFIFLYFFIFFIFKQQSSINIAGRVSQAPG